MTVATIIFLGGCGVHEVKNLSERRSGFFYATDGKYALTAISGVRETDYAQDGLASELKPYTLITLAPVDKAAFDIDEEYSYQATVGYVDGVTVSERSFGGGMVMHPFAASYSAEFDFETTQSFKVKISIGTQSYEYELTSIVPEDAIDYKTAIDVAKGELELVGAYEIRARLIKNPVDRNDGLCWHVAFISGEGASGVLIDPTTARIIAVKKS